MSSCWCLRPSPRTLARCPEDLGQRLLHALARDVRVVRSSRPCARSYGSADVDDAHLGSPDVAVGRGDGFEQDASTSSPT